MARRHFDSKGFPKLNEIIMEICQYVEGLEIKYTDFPFTGDVIDPRNTKYGKETIIENVDFVQGISERPFKVNEIYIVGGQVAYLPKAYHTGEHDLDMIVRTNANRVTFTPGAGGAIWLNLGDILNNGKGCSSERDGKKFALDLFDEHKKINPLEPPYLQIYPIMKKVES